MSKLDIFTKYVKDCQRCGFREIASQVIPGIGPINSKIVFVSDYPNDEEDVAGEPLFGRHGEYFNKLIKESGLSRGEVFITCLIKCYHKKLKVEEYHVDSCKYWLHHEFRIIEPKVIVPLGVPPVNFFIKQKYSIMKAVVGKIYYKQYKDKVVKFMPWYAIDYVLNRGEAAEKQTVAWFKRIKEESEKD